MITNRTKEEIYHMLSYILDPEDTKDESLVAHWTDVLFEVHKIRQRFPRPTKGLLEINNNQFPTRKMNINTNQIHIDSNHSEKWIETNTPDMKVFGDVTIESCEKNLTIIGNINSESIVVGGNVQADTICNFGNLTINCDKLNIEDLRASGNLIINCKEIISSDFYADKLDMTGNIKSTFLSTNELNINGNINGTVNYEKKEELIVDLNKP